MAFISFSYVFALLSAITLIHGQTPVCGPNERFSNCGSVCIETCDYRPEVCVLMCKSGCFCQEGYVRQSNATGSPCIKRERCKRMDDTHLCGAHQRYNNCGSACVETCDFKPEICTEQCVAGCFCSEANYVRRDNQAGSPCIRRDQCPKSKH